MASNLVPTSKSGLVKGETLPAILDAGGKAARFAYQEFFSTARSAILTRAWPTTER